LPFLTILAPSKGYYESEIRCHKKLTDWEIVFQLRRWLPNRYLVVVADYRYAVLEFLAACQELSNPVTIITRLRFDAALYRPAPPYSGIGRSRKIRNAVTYCGYHCPSPKHSMAECHTYLVKRATKRNASHFTARVWYHTGKPPVSIRWVLARAPRGTYEPITLLSTDTTRCPRQIAETGILVAGGWKSLLKKGIPP
jgi:hypothetical protein